MFIVVLYTCMTLYLLIISWIVEDMNRKLAGVNEYCESCSSFRHFLYFATFFEFKHTVTLKLKLVLLVYKHAYSTTNFFKVNVSRLF